MEVPRPGISLIIDIEEEKETPFYLKQSLLILLSQLPAGIRAKSRLSYQRIPIS